MVLVLDDFEDLLDLARSLIERLCNHPVVTAKSMAEVVALGERALTCKLALLDINLGPNEPTGVDVYQWLRCNGFQSPVVFLTGHAPSHPTVAEAQRLGDVTVLTKPVPTDVLLRLIRGTIP